MLESDDESSLLTALSKLGNLTAFKEFQALVREYGGLAKISSLVHSSSSNVKMQALNVLNNLAMDTENQRYLKSLIPDLTHMLRHDSDTISLAVARVLTNLTAVDENHGLIIPHVFLLLEVLRASELTIKLQVLKILVNISTNPQVTENELEIDIQVIRGVGDFLDSSCDDEIVLRSVTCLANILSALRNRWQNRHRSQISTAEFVPENMELRLKELQHHENENIAWHAERALAALQPSVGGETPRTREKIDLIELLQL